jgi:hypothetical protein
MPALPGDDQESDGDAPVIVDLREIEASESKNR